MPFNRSVKQTFCNYWCGYNHRYRDALENYEPPRHNSDLEQNWDEAYNSLWRLNEGLRQRTIIRY